jgi:protein involved in polysaccharide export with SLBB domain
MVITFKKRLILILTILLANNSLFSQNFLSTTDFTKLEAQNLSDQEIQQIRDEMNKKNISIETVENIAISKGMSPANFNILKSKIEFETPKSNVENGTSIPLNPIAMDAESQNNPRAFKSQIFGSDLFTNPSLSFEPNSNMATPMNYILGTGDELQIVIYGIQEYAVGVHVSKEGKITIPNVGQLSVNGMTFEAASVVIKKACGNVFSTLKSGQSDISITLSKIRTIKITIIGAQKSGNYSVSSLSTVYNALYLAGGPNLNGSYRNIELIRNNKVIRKIDIYKFIINGDQSDNLGLRDNDIIRIPIYTTRVSIEGEVKKSGIFELIPGENFKTLLNYCSGFSEAAYLSSIKLIQNTDKELKIIDLTKNDFEAYVPKSGDVLKVGTILNKFENRISIKGAVYRPDEYSLTEGLRLLDLINKAEGLTEDAFKNRAQITRLTSNFSKEIISIDLNKVFAGDSSQNIRLQKEDEIFIFSLFDFKNSLSIHLGGEVRKAGEYPFVKNLKLYDLIIQAGGFTDLASKRIEISRLIKKDQIIENQEQIASIIVIEVDSLLSDVSKNISLEANDVIQVRKIPIYTLQKNAVVSGSVQYPGQYAISNNQERVMDIITRAGGLKVDANKEAIFIKRGDYNIPIDYLKISKKPSSIQNIRIQPGDEIVVRKYVAAIKIVGGVNLNSEIPFKKNKSVKYYVNSCGGFSDRAWKKEVYAVYPNGEASDTKSFLFFKKYPKIRPGSLINVPIKSERKERSASEIVSLAGVTTSMATMIAIVSKLFQ